MDLRFVKCDISSLLLLEKLFKYDKSMETCISFLLLVLLIMVAAEGNYSENNNHEILSSTTRISSSYYRNKTCLSNSNYKGSMLCTKPSSCGRYFVDDVFESSDIGILRDIANKALNTRIETIGGPTIIDINTGYIRDTNGLTNLFTGDIKIYDDDDFDHYGRIIKKLKSIIEDVFKIKDVYFTAPTFITVIKGSEDWSPNEIHDEYWHLHVDHNNTSVCSP